VEGLRGFSILLVFVFHLSDVGAHNWGALGVSLFFIISGYVITGSMFRQLSASSSRSLDFSKFLMQFYTRRARRLFPLAIVVILSTLTISFFDPTSDKKQYILSSIFCLLYVGNLFGFTFGYSDLAPALGHFWSLAVEEQFYLLWPIIFYFALRNFDKIDHLLKWITLGIVLIEISHPLIALAGITVWTLPTTYFDLLLLGCALYLIHTRILNIEGRGLTTLYLAGAVSLALVIFGSRFSASSNLSNFQYNWNFLLTGILFIFGLRSNLFNNYIFRFFGKISYSLYCIHAPLIVFCKNFLGWNYLLVFLVAVASIALSALSYRYFEAKFYKPLLTS
jgi:peptidoglycan/LPS O-acetylase OafA/YrhL